MTSHRPGLIARAARTAMAVLALFVMSRPSLAIAADAGPATRPDLSSPAAAFAALGKAAADLDRDVAARKFANLEDAGKAIDERLTAAEDSVEKKPASPAKPDAKPSEPKTK